MPMNEAKRNLQPEDRGVLLQLVLLRGSRSCRHEPSASYPADVKIIRVPCSCRVNPMFILRAFQTRRGRRYHLRLPSGRLPLYIRQLLCPPPYDAAFLDARLPRYREGAHPSRVGLRRRGRKVRRDHERLRQRRSRQLGKKQEIGGSEMQASNEKTRTQSFSQTVTVARVIGWKNGEFGYDVTARSLRLGGGA